MLKLGIYILAFGTFVGATPILAQGLTKPMKDGLEKSVITYNECILDQFKQRTLMQEAPIFEKALIPDTIAACEERALVMRTILTKIPGATKKIVDDELNELRFRAGKKLLSILAVLILANELPADSNR